MKVKIIPRTLGEIALIIGCSCPIELYNKTVTNITIDSRSVEDGSLFIALVGQNFDANDFIDNALVRGAVGVISTKPGRERLVVEDCTIAIGKLASHIRDEINPIIIGITGSVGKTTTKEFIYSVISQKFISARSEGNHNNELGLPLSLISMPKETQVAVFEFGMSGFGEIEYLSKIAKPDFAVITNIGTSHIEKLGSREGIACAKLEILNGLRANTCGHIILNGDEALLSGVHGAIYVSRKNCSSDYFITNIYEGTYGTSFDLFVHGKRVDSITIPCFGEHNVFNAAIAFAVGTQFGMGEFEIRRGLMEYCPQNMRQCIYDFKSLHIIEDCYNAAPESMIAAMNVLKSISLRNNGRRIAVLGDMKELGEYSKSLHYQVGEYTAKIDIDLLITIGDEAKNIYDKAVSLLPENVVLWYNIVNDDSIDEIANSIAKLVKSGDTILFKASRAMKFELLVEKFKSALI